jgi:hypothetical protein
MILAKLPFSSCVIIFSSLLVLLILTIITVILSLNINALGQNPSSSSSSSNTSTTTTTQQTWIDKLNNIKMQFGYLPREPVIDKPTELKFIVQNLQTGGQIKNLSARVIVINNAGEQQRFFKFTNITAPNGIFSVKYLFPDSGVYNVITKIDSKDFTSLASFTVPVPLPSLNGDILSPIVLGGIIAVILVAATVLLWMKRKKSVN